MNLRYSPTLLALVSAISAAGARRTGGLVLGSGLTKLLTPRQDDGNEKNTNRRHLAGSISTSVIERATVDGRSYYPDVGILQGGKSLRRLGDVHLHDIGQRSNVDSIGGANTGLQLRFLEAEMALKCGTNGTCAPSICNHFANFFNIYSSAASFNSICNGYIDANGKNWTFGGCFPDYLEVPRLQEYMRNLGCQLAKCFDDGGAYGSCYCQAYHSACEKYGDQRLYEIDKRALGFCAADACCQNQTDDAGKRKCTTGQPIRYEYRQENPICGINGTCSPSVCNCFANGINIFDCAISYYDICNGAADANGTIWGFEGCFRDYPGYPDYQLYSRTAKCDFAKCIVDGGTYGSCYCQMYHTMCEQFGNKRQYNYDAEAPGHCVIDSCCQTKTDEDGRMSCLGIFTSPATIEYPNITATDAVGDPPTGSDLPPDTSTGDSPASGEPSSGAVQTVMLPMSAGVMSSIAAIAIALWSILGMN